MILFFFFFRRGDPYPKQRAWNLAEGGLRGGGISRNKFSSQHLNTVSDKYPQGIRARCELASILQKNHGSEKVALTKVSSPNFKGSVQQKRGGRKGATQSGGATGGHGSRGDLIFNEIMEQRSAYPAPEA